MTKVGVITERTRNETNKNHQNKNRKAKGGRTKVKEKRKIGRVEKRRNAENGVEMRCEGERNQIS